MIVSARVSEPPSLFGEPRPEATHVRLVFDSVFQLNHIIVAALRCGVGGRRSDSEAAEGFRRTVSGRRLSPETLGVDREQWMQLWAAVTDKPFTRVSKINQGYFARGMRAALLCPRLPCF